MLKNADYLHVSKRKPQCLLCGDSLVERERHPSALLEPKDAEKMKAAFQTEEQKEAEAAEEESPANPKQDDKKKSKEEKNKKEEPVFFRADYCESCWNKMKEEAWFSFWIGKRTTSDLPKKRLNRTERNLALVALFDSLSDRIDGENDFTPHLFFIAHLLMKFKIFKWHPSEENPQTGETTLRFSRSDSEDEVRISDMEMPPEMIVKVKEEIESYLEESTGQIVKL